MTLSLTAHLAYDLPAPCDVLLQIEAAALPEQAVLNASLELPSGLVTTCVAGHDAIGQRIWLQHQGRLEVSYQAAISVERIVTDLSGLDALAPRLLPGETIPYLADSAYCPATRFQPFVQQTFPGLSGGALVLALRDWIAGHLAYAPGTSDARTTALDSFVERRGVCRDFAHLLIAMVRAAAIPARYVSAYAPGVTPQDFHALAEVFLADPSGTGGIWLMVDATGMADPAQTAKIAVGRDAADASFMTSWGNVLFAGKEITVTAG